MLPYFVRGEHNQASFRMAKALLMKGSADFETKNFTKEYWKDGKKVTDPDEIAKVEAEIEKDMSGK